MIDELLGKKFDVLDDGFVRVVDFMGDDSAIVQAARVSYGDGTKKKRSDRGLIRYLIRHHHTTPLEMCEIKFHVRVPMDCWRQWIRHRTASVNEYSTRYSLAIDSAQRTTKDKWRIQSKSNRQGSSGYFDEAIGEELTAEEAALQAEARRVYDSRIERGVAREQARKDLPLSTYTEAYWKIDLHNLLHFLLLRMEDNSQAEIRAYARLIGHEIVAKWCPVAWEAFLDYRVNGRTLSALEVKMMRSILKEGEKAALEYGAHLGWLDDSGARKKRVRELSEFEEKANEMGLKLPWS